LIGDVRLLKRTPELATQLVGEAPMSKSILVRVVILPILLAALVAAPVARAQKGSVDQCCCETPPPLPLQDEHDESAKAAMITGATFLLVGYAVSMSFGLASDSITNRWLGFVPVAGSAGMAWNSRENPSMVGGLIFATWAQAVGVMVLALGASQRHRTVLERLSFGAAPTPGGASGSIAVKF
jgi:hypothetical protein